jgi:hypothetical protein
MFTPISIATPCSLDRLLDLSARQEREGLGDAPWPPHYRKQPDEPARVQPSRRRSVAGSQKSRDCVNRAGRSSKLVGRSARRTRSKVLERWRMRHPEAAAHLHPSDVLVDAMRGRFHTWTRIRVNLEHVPDDLRPTQEPLDPDAAPKGWGPSDGGAEVSEARPSRRTPSRARKEP